MNPLQKAYEIFVIEKRIPWFIKRRLDYKYYVKILVGWMFRLVRLTRPIESNEESDFQVCTLLDHGNVNPYLIAIKSFIGNSRIKPYITIVSDGSLNDKDKEVLRHHINGVHIHDPIVITEKDKETHRLLVADEARKKNALCKKIYDIHGIASRKVIILFDSDLIFFRTMDESLFNLDNNIKIRYNKDHDHSVRDRHFHNTQAFIERNSIPVHKLITDLNSGFVIIDSDSLNLDIMVKYIEYLYENNAFYLLMEQDAWNILASTVPSEAMPDSYAVGDNVNESRSSITKKEIISFHYVSSMRYHSLDYLAKGMKTVLKLV